METGTDDSFDLGQVSFPALVVADDGWVTHAGSKDDLSIWTYSAVKQYNQQRVVLFDSADQAWLVKSITPLKQLNLFSKFLAQVTNRKLSAKLQVERVADSPLQRVKELLEMAIDKDDDILTQDTEANDLKAAVRTATSFKTLVATLKAKGAIVTDDDQESGAL